MITNQSNAKTGTVPKEKSSKSTKQQQPRKPPPTVDTFWPAIMQEVQNTPVVDAKHQALPLARIKKIMKLDENAKMIAAEAPLLFAKACEFFIQELTMRAWTHTDESKRRTLQRSDIAQAIANYDQFDFLIDIVPRDDIKPTSHRKNNTLDTNSANNGTATASAGNASTQDIMHVTADTVGALPQVPNQQATATVNVGTPNSTQTATQVLTASNPPQQLQIIQQTAQPQQLQYFITLPGQQQGQGQLQLHQLQLQQQQQLPNTIATPLTATNLNLVAQQPQQLILTATNPNNQATNITQQQQQAAMIQNLVQQQQQQQQQQQNAQAQQPQLQLFQQVVVSPTGEITNMPIAINANQLNLLRLQLQQQQQQSQQTQVTHQPTQQQVIVPTQLLTAQQLLQLQTNHANSNNNPAPTATIVHHQPHHNNSQPGTNTIYLNAATATTTPATVQTSLVSTDRNIGNTYRNNC